MPQTVLGRRTHRDFHRLEKVSGKAAALNGELAQLPLLVGLFQDVLLHGAFANEAVDVDVARLANAVAAVLGLRIEEERAGDDG